MARQTAGQSYDALFNQMEQLEEQYAERRYEYVTVTGTAAVH